VLVDDELALLRVWTNGAHPADVSDLVSGLRAQLGPPVTVLRCLCSEPQPDGDTVHRCWQAERWNPGCGRSATTLRCSAPGQAKQTPSARSAAATSIFHYAAKIEALQAHNQWWLPRFVPWLEEIANREAASLVW